MPDRLTNKQVEALVNVWNLDSAQVISDQASWYDDWTAFVHWQTADALERRGLVTIDDGDLTLTDAGWKYLE